MTRAIYILCIKHLRILRLIGNRTRDLLHCRLTLYAKSRSNGVRVVIRNLSLCCYRGRSPIFGSMPRDFPSCTHWLRHRNPFHPPEFGLVYEGRYWSAQDRRHLFITPWPGQSAQSMIGRTTPCTAVLSGILLGNFLLTNVSFTILDVGIP